MAYWLLLYVAHFEQLLIFKREDLIAILTNWNKDLVLIITSIDTMNKSYDIIFEILKKIFADLGIKTKTSLLEVNVTY